METTLSKGIIFFLICTFCHAATTSKRRGFHGACNEEKSFCPKPTNNQRAEISKHDAAEFKRCPSTTHLCLHGDSNVYLNSTSSIYVLDFGFLKIAEGGSLTVLDDGFCQISSRSLLTVDTNASLVIKKESILTTSVHSEISNQGSIHLGDGSKLFVNEFSKWTVSESGSMDINQDSYISMSNYSTVNVGYKSNLKTIAKSKVDISLNAALEIQNGNMIMGDGSEISVRSYSSLQLAPLKCNEYYPSVELVLSSKSKLTLKSYSRAVVRGSVLVNDNCWLTLKDGSSLFVNGLLEIAADLDKPFKRIVIGPEDELPCGGDTSLIVTTQRVIPEKLTVKEGAHCFTKNIEHWLDMAEEVVLNATSDTIRFTCFDSRNALLLALGRHGRP